MTWHSLCLFMDVPRLMVRERLILHIYKTLEANGGDVNTFLLTQTGMSQTFNLPRGHIAVELERGIQRGLIKSVYSRPRSMNRKVKAYVLTQSGKEFAEALNDRIRDSIIAEEVARDAQSHRPADVVNAVNEMKQAALLAIMLYGKPFPSSLIRGEGRIPYVVCEAEKCTLSPVAYEAVKVLESRETICRRAYSLIADACLIEGNFTMRLKALVASGRMNEASALIEMHRDEMEVAEPSFLLPLLDRLKGGEALLLLRARMMVVAGKIGEAAALLSKSKSTEGRLMRSLLDCSAPRLDASDMQPHTPREEILSMRLEAMYLQANGNAAAAARLLRKAQRLASSHGDRAELFFIYRQLSEVEREMGDEREAERLLLKLESLGRAHR
ncbi:MAG: hypothetical protein QXP70_06020 [Methanomassiliicoccales archaeon]